MLNIKRLIGLLGFSGRGNGNFVANEDSILISESSFFDREWYLSQYPHIRESGVDPVYHYLHQGWLEMLDPSPSFSTEWYQRNNPDVGRMGINPLLHFIRYGINDGLAPSPIAMLRRKSRVRELDVDELIRKFLNEIVDLPEAANDFNGGRVRGEWLRYFLNKAAISYEQGDFFNALTELTSAIQVYPDNENSYVMCQYVFERFNKKEIDEFVLNLTNARLIVAHISCRSRIDLAKKSVLSFQNSADDIRHLIVIGDPELQKNKFTFESESMILKVPSSDSYEGLPSKIRNFFLFLGMTSLEVPVLKIDDNIHCKNISKLREDLEEVVLKRDYGGFTVNAKPFSLYTHWHLRKCANSEINTTVDSLLYSAPFATGPSYWLGSEAINLISKIALAHARHFETEIFEDRAVGEALNVYGINPYHYSFADSGSLESIEKF